jgi:hypothetical protein
MRKKLWRMMQDIVENLEQKNIFFLITRWWKKPSQSTIGWVFLAALAALMCFMYLGKDDSGLSGFRFTCQRILLVDRQGWNPYTSR